MEVGLRGEVTGFNEVTLTLTLTLKYTSSGANNRRATIDPTVRMRRFK